MTRFSKQAAIWESFRRIFTLFPHLPTASENIASKREIDIKFSKPMQRYAFLQIKSYMQANSPAYKYFTLI